MVKIAVKTLLGLFFIVLMYAGVSLVGVKSAQANSCVNSGVYTCVTIEVQDGFSGGPGLPGVTVSMEIGPYRSGGFCNAPCLQPGVYQTTTDAFGNANFDNVPCTAAVQYIRFWVTKPGYQSWPVGSTFNSATWASYTSVANAPAAPIDINIFLSPNAPPPQPPPPPPSGNLVLQSQGPVCFAGGNYINYQWSITDGQIANLIVATDWAMTAIVWNTPVGNSSGGNTFTPPSPNTTYYAQLNRFAYVGNKVANFIGSLSCAPITPPPPPPPPPPQPPPVTVDIRANGARTAISIPYNTAATITWTSSNATTCTVAPFGWTGTSGSQSSGAVTSVRLFQATCNGPGGTATDSVAVSTTPPLDDFSITISPTPQTIYAGASTTYTVQVTAVNGFDGTVDLTRAWQGPASGVSFVSLTPNRVNVGSPYPPSATAVLRINSTASASRGTFPFTVTGTSGALTHAANATLNVSAPLPPRPWVITENGNVGSRGGISNLDDLVGHQIAANNSNTEYIRQTCTSAPCIMSGAFLSFKNWLVDTAPEPKAPNRVGDATTGFYHDLQAGNACLLERSKDIPSEKGKYRVAGDLTVDGGSYSVPRSQCPAQPGKSGRVIFVDGNLTIKRGRVGTVDYGGSRPTIFFVSGKITVNSSVDKLNAVLVSDGGFNDVNNDNTDNLLQITGAIISSLGGSGQVILSRNLPGEVSEHITFDPSYFYYLTDLAGISMTHYKEERP